MQKNFDADDTKEKIITFKFNTSDCSKEDSSTEEDNVAFLTKKFRNFLKNKKQRFDQKKVKRKIKNSSKVANLIC